MWNHPGIQDCFCVKGPTGRYMRKRIVPGGDLPNWRIDSKLNGGQI